MRASVALFISFTLILIFPTTGATKYNLNDDGEDEDVDGDYGEETGEGGRQMKGITQLEMSLGQNMTGGVDAAKHPSNRNKTKQREPTKPLLPTVRIPFFNTLQASSQEINEEKEEPDSIGTKVEDPVFPSPDRETGGRQSVQRRQIRCICDTSDCLSSKGNNGGNATTCLTSGGCFIQIMDFGDGKPPVSSKGCIGLVGECNWVAENNLLCENRRPKNARLWPNVACCNTDLCNYGAFPNPKTNLSLPSSPSEGSTSINQNRVPHRSNEHDEAEDAAEDAGDRHEKVKSDNRPDNEDAIGVWSRKNLKKSSGTRGRSTVVSPLASSFLIGGAIIVVVISIVGFYILRREQRQTALYYRKDLEERMRDLDDMDDGDQEHLPACDNRTCLNITTASIPSTSDPQHLLIQQNSEIEIVEINSAT